MLTITYSIQTEMIVGMNLGRAAVLIGLTSTSSRLASALN
jgi:hypothetical protein